MDFSTISNLEAYRYRCSLSHAIEDFFTPFFKMSGLSTFIGGRFYQDGRNYLIFSNSPSFLEHHFHFFHDNGNVFQTAVRQAPLHQFYHFIWPSDPLLPEIKNDVQFSAYYYKLNMWYGISIYRKTLEYVEGWTFTPRKNQTQIINFYINNKENLEKIILEFNQKFLSRINLQQAIVQLKSPIDMSPLPYPYLHKPQEKFKDSQRIFMEGIGWVYLTPRELEVSQLLKRGRTAKEIGLYLGTQYRTVEKQIQNIKEKLHVCTKGQIITAVEKWL